MAKVRQLQRPTGSMRKIVRPNKRWSRQRPNNRGYAGSKEHVPPGTAVAITLAPTTKVANSGNFSLSVTAAAGTFDSNSSITFNGVRQTTGFLSSAQIQCTISNTSGSTTGAKTVFANGINGQTANATFTYT